jgi:hypothetical protein
MNAINLIIDIATNRVVYATTDLEQPLFVDDTVILFQYTGQVPSNFSNKNSWNFRLVGHELVEALDNLATAGRRSVFETNRQNFIKLIDTDLQTARNEKKKQLGITDFKNDCLDHDVSYFDQLNNIDGPSASEYKEKLDEYRKAVRDSEQIADTFKFYAKQTSNDTQLLAIRDLFKNRTITTLKQQNSTIIEILASNQQLDFNIDEADWNVNTNRQAHLYEQQYTQSIPLVDIVLENNLKSPKDSWHSTTTQKTPFYEKYSAVTDWLEQFATQHNAELCKAAIVKLKPGGVVYDHEDYGGYYIDKDRYHLTIAGDYFFLVEQDHFIKAKPGTLFWFDNKFKHMAFNNTNTDRISVIFDIKPNNLQNLKSKAGREHMLDLLKKDRVYLENEKINKEKL